MSKIEHLIIFAGPSCIGKTTLIDAILKNELLDISKQLEINLKNTWKYVDAWHFDSLNTLDQESNLIVHYDFFRRFNLKNLDFTSDKVLAVLAKAKRVDIVTLYESKDKLLRNCQNRRKKVWKFLFKYKSFDALRRLVYHEKKCLLYHDTANLEHIYKQWFIFFQNKPQYKYWKYKAKYLEAINISDSIPFN